MNDDYLIIGGMCKGGRIIRFLLSFEGIKVQQQIWEVFEYFLWVIDQMIS